MAQGKEPGVGGGTSAIHDGVGDALDVLVTTFGVVLLLLTRFALPIIDGEVAKDVFNFCADLNLRVLAFGCLVGLDRIELTVNRDGHSARLGHRF